MKRRYLVIRYKASPGDKERTVSFLPVLANDENKLRELNIAAECNSREPWRDAIVDEYEAEYIEPKPEYCMKCGSLKTVDHFKGVYCPRCNDWC